MSVAPTLWRQIQSKRRGYQHLTHHHFVFMPWLVRSKLLAFTETRGTNIHVLAALGGALDPHSLRHIDAALFTISTDSVHQSGKDSHPSHVALIPGSVPGKMHE